jgi:SAM-dependent methyltransferase
MDSLTTNISSLTINVPTIDTHSFIELKKYYDEVLNKDKSTYKSSNDEPTPIDCICEMMSKLPSELWYREDLRILDPCCGNGNFAIPAIENIQKNRPEMSMKDILEKTMVFNDTNKDRLENVRNVFLAKKYALQIHNTDYLEDISFHNEKYDLVMANPPYAKLLETGKRASKNHNMIKEFIEKSIRLLKPNGYLLFITPDNWTSYADRNTLIEKLTELQIIHLDIHRAKKYFKKVGSSFTWYIIQNCPFYKEITISGIWKKNEYTSTVISQKRKYIPLLYNEDVHAILQKTVDNNNLPKFQIKTSSDLHKYTKASLICERETDVHKYRLIHTPSQTVYSTRPHKWQNGYKVFISTTDKYMVFVDNCGMTQSIAFILCDSEEEANKYMLILRHPLYVFINNICRWGNFNNIRILQQFPVPSREFIKKYNGENVQDIYEYFGISMYEQQHINENM